MATKKYDSKKALFDPAAQEMTLDEKQEKIATFLHDNRRLFLSLYGQEKLNACVAEWRPHIDRLCELIGCSVLGAMKEILTDGSVGENGKMMLIAAIAEILDPSTAEKVA